MYLSKGHLNDCVRIWKIGLDEDCTQFKEVPFLSPFHQQITIFSTLYFSLTIHRLFYFSLLPFVPLLPYMHGQCLSLNPFFLSHSLFTMYTLLYTLSLHINTISSIHSISDVLQSISLPSMHSLFFRPRFYLF